MLPLPKGAAWHVFILTLALIVIKEINAEQRIVCYYTNWSVYRPGTAKFTPQNINPYLCTHLIYAFGGFTKDNTLKPFDKYQDIEKGGYAKFNGLKSYNKKLKTLLALGGWNEGSSRFSPLVANQERRQQFIKNILKFLRQNHFDGLDLDWEYPAFRDGGKPKDKENYAQFVEELRTEFDRESSKTGRTRLLLTMAVPAGVQYIDKGFDVPKLNKYLDWFNLLSYDYHSAYEPSVNHHAPLYPLEEESEYNYDGDLNIENTIKYYIQAGADRSKLVLGIPTYGRSYTLFNEEDTEMGAPADGPGEQGDATREKGYLAYYEICENLKADKSWTVAKPSPNAIGPYAYRGKLWVGYDDEEMVRRKAQYVSENSLGGIMFWSIDNDDFRGTCTGKPYPLIEAAKETLLEYARNGDNEIVDTSQLTNQIQTRSRASNVNRNTVVNDTGSNSSKKAGSRRSSNKKKKISTTRRTTTTTTTQATKVTGRTTTPAPPTTPDPGGDFKCEDEGFFAHPRDCKKYYWCLDSGPSNLGIVAHQFTCPSGLYFNTAADSCDFSRNVLCKKNLKSVTTTKPTTITTKNPTLRTSTTPLTTTYRITRATSTTTIAPHFEEEEEDYEEIDEDENIDEAEEDPKVLKELIELIKKIGGVEELEKHIKSQETPKSEVSTTPLSISKSLYAKVLNPSRSFTALKNRLSQKNRTKSTEEYVDEVNSKEFLQKNHNSRPRPQNEGIGKLAETEGFLKEKPKYVTINRKRPTVPLSAKTEEDIEDDEDEEIEEDVEDEIIEEVIPEQKVSAYTPAYVNIRRSRPSTEKIQTTQEPENIVLPRVTYASLKRVRSTTSIPDVILRYNSVQRTRSSPLLITEANEIIENPSTSRLDITTNQQDKMVGLSDHFLSTTRKTQELATNTRSYSNIERKITTIIATELNTDPVTTIASDLKTSRIPSTISTSILTTPEISTLINRKEFSEATIDSSDKELKTQTTELNSDNIYQIPTNISEKVKLGVTRAGVEINEKNTLLTITNSNNKLSSENNDVPTTSTLTKIGKPLEETSTLFLGTISSPRPFGFPRQRFRPTQRASTTELTTESNKIRPSKRHPVVNARRRLGTTSNQLNNNSPSSTESSSFSVLNTRYNRRKKPTVTQKTIVTPTTELKPDRLISKDTLKTTSKFVLRRKFVRPTSRRTSLTTIATIDKNRTSTTTTITPKTSNPLFKRRRPLISIPTIPISTATTPISVTRYTETEIPTAIDQQAGSSIQDTKIVNKKDNQVREELDDDLVEAITAISRAPIPILSNTKSNNLVTPNKKADIYHSESPITLELISKKDKLPTLFTEKNLVSSTFSPAIIKFKKTQPFDKIASASGKLTGRTYRPIENYDYYDDEDLSVLGQSISQVKVVLHGRGIIECLDQGNFPHPLSCRKFISCAKMETGGVVGWEYTCPKGLSYDPVGGICNWSAGLGCKE